mmetsp:Transcript_34275/g.86647  ORF Transcript_34275/g.86647 Transcript_34275/m.86647 type:complete len:190 (-) Transcript_34275:133-702(-)|eukprot:CAMPEP_0173422474 /NCGR_PEP_ID=MMETSP1357-20121228/3166_1 /TAXON_ID=77926 /ORGANISM="Hemiselmis rufescens, Strain PCC563" /LENGTH=189 /DNA_ID=CAMNT_0014385503 /DNA_START=170 /DNA_END=739 /DNA_ORIENTATION=+
MSLGIVNPKKRREIEGVSNTTLIDLKATLFSAEETAKRSKAEGLPVERGKLKVKAPTVQNKGIEERMRRDQEELEKKLDPSEALGAKMQHYQSLAHEGFRDEGERFLVDFERKAWETSRQGHREGQQQDALSVVMRGPRSSTGGREDGIEEGVMRELEEGRGKGKESAQALKAKRLAAAKKRMEMQKKG